MVSWYYVSHHPSQENVHLIYSVACLSVSAMQVPAVQQTNQGAVSRVPVVRLWSDTRRHQSCQDLPAGQELCRSPAQWWKLMSTYFWDSWFGLLCLFCILKGLNEGSKMFFLVDLNLCSCRCSHMMPWCHLCGQHINSEQW